MPDLRRGPQRGEPLLVRAGARYECHGDGLCCSDIHALGPLTLRERVQITSIRSDVVEEHPRLGLPVLAPQTNRACAFFEGDAGCRVHREQGERTKPSACRRFPFGAVRTPDGIRITTAHRCPCRSVGPRKPLDPNDAHRALATHAGKLRIDFEAPKRFAITDARRVGFTTYRQIEDEAFASLAAETEDDAPMPELVDSDWTDVAHAHRAMIDGTSSGEALAWFGDALLAELGVAGLRRRSRPWSWSFDRAERRADKTRSGEEVFTDFARDVIWNLEWSLESSLAVTVARLDVARRCARRMAAAFRREGASDERAFAEAVAITEVALSGPFGYAKIAVRPLGGTPL